MAYDVTTFERTVNGKTQYKTVPNINLNSRRARQAYAEEGWVKSAGKDAKPVGVAKVKKSKTDEPVNTAADGLDTNE